MPEKTKSSHPTNNTTLESIIKKHYKDPDELDLLFQSYINLTFHPEKFSNDEGIEIIYGTNDLLTNLANPFFDYGRFKDTWDNSSFHINTDGQTLLFKSIKTNHTFDFGIDRQSIYLRSYVSYPENLKNMNDQFWNTFLRLSEYGEFSFDENASISSAESQYFNNKKSNLFRLLRNYFLRDINNMELEPHQRNYDMNLGWLEIKWNFGTPWLDIIRNGCLAFKDLYHLHYELWKISDLREKKK